MWENRVQIRMGFLIILFYFSELFTNIAQPVNRIHGEDMSRTVTLTKR